MLFLSHIALFFPWQHFLDKMSYVGVESSCCDLQVTLTNDTALPSSHVKFNLLIKVLLKSQPTQGGLGKRAALLQTERWTSSWPSLVSFVSLLCL